MAKKWILIHGRHKLLNLEEIKEISIQQNSVNWWSIIAEKKDGTRDTVFIADKKGKKGAEKCRAVLRKIAKKTRAIRVYKL